LDAQRVLWGIGACHAVPHEEVDKKSFILSRKGAPRWPERGAGGVEHKQRLLKGEGSGESHRFNFIGIAKEEMQCVLAGIFVV
jgi:hypothetical protein